MSKHPSKDGPPAPRVTPCLLYEDVDAAVLWLCDAFGFCEVLRYRGAGGSVQYAEMRYHDGYVLLGNPGSDYRNPNRNGGISSMTCVRVDDVDDHHRRARAAGATILSEPVDRPYGDRSYGALDLAGHRWEFSQPVRRVAPEEWGAVRAPQ